MDGEMKSRSKRNVAQAGLFAEYLREYRQRRAGTRGPAAKGDRPRLVETVRETVTTDWTVQVTLCDRQIHGILGAH